MEMECIVQGVQGNIFSRYSRETLIDILASYNSENALVVIDIDDCVRDSPAKRMAMLGLSYPSLFIPNFCWGLYTLKEIASEILQGGSIKDAETASFAYYRKNVIGELSSEQRERLAERSLTPLYPGTQEFVSYFSAARRIIVSRNINEIVKRTVQELGCSTGYAEQDYKKAKVLENVERYESRRVLIIGDSKEDAVPIKNIRAKGFGVDFVYVMKGNDPKKMHPEATIGITNRNFAPLYALLAR